MASEFSETGNNDSNDGFWTPFAEGVFDDLPDFSELANNDEVPVVNPDNPLGFRQEFDGRQAEVSREDAEATRQLFDGAIADTHAAHVEHIRSLPGSNNQFVILEYPMSDTESVESTIVDWGKHSSIDAARVSDGEIQEQAHYQIATDTGRIIRFDMDVVEKPNELDLDKLGSSDRETAAQLTEEFISAQSNVAENLGLGGQMGVNGQEVGPAELQAVNRILKASRPYYNN
jgi:hypothetical protein